MRRAVAAVATLSACTSAPPPAPPAATATCPAVAPSPAPAPAKTTPPCRKRDPGADELIASMTSSLNQPEQGALQTHHSQFPRWFPALHERGFVRSIVATHTNAEHGPVFALTLLVRNTNGGLDATLAFATPGCAGGDLAPIGEPIPLGAPEAVIEWASRVPIAAPLTELKVRVGDAPNPLMGPERGRRRLRDVLVTSRVVASFDVESDLPPEGGVRRHDEALGGTGWYTLADGGAAFLLVHRAVDDRDDLCKQKAKARPFRPPELRTLARVDAHGAFVGGADKVGSAFVIGIPENQPPESMSTDKTHTLRTAYGESTPAQWLYGIYDSADTAKAHMQTLEYKTGKVFTASPPTTVDVKPNKDRLRLDCDMYF
ncbi:MAG: hypothetical protein KIT84_04140 [Labilithrix sp.]|nr:hypothetical protein [Labilithrix sp.]MCW5810176.1 hypothetical protein [Labilithrix sp.]